MGRLLWFAAGAGAAVYGSVKARRLAHRLTPAGLGDQAAALRLGADALLEDIRTGAREREADLLAGVQRPHPDRAGRTPPVPLHVRASDKDTG